MAANQVNENSGDSEEEEEEGGDCVCVCVYVCRTVCQFLPLTHGIDLSDRLSHASWQEGRVLSTLEKFHGTSVFVSAHTDIPTYNTLRVTRAHRVAQNVLLDSAIVYIKRRFTYKNYMHISNTNFIPRCQDIEFVS